MSTLWEFMWENLPPGFRFHPTDEEFVNHYLTNYIHGVKDRVNVIPVVDDLFKRDPSELPRLFRGSSIIRSSDPEWWFLSTLRCNSRNADKFDRSTGKGSWKITGNAKEICKSGVKIAEMRNLVFCENPREKAKWVIHEYYLTGTSLGRDPSELRQYVLCHLVKRRDDYTEMSRNMEVELVFEEPQHQFSEELIQAMMRSLMDGPPSPATNAPLHNPQERPETLFCTTEVNPVDNFDEMEHLMSTSSGEKEDNILDLLNYVDFSMDEESARSDEFEVLSPCYYQQLLEPEETSRAASNHVVLKENRQARSPGTLEGYVVVDENRRFVEEDFQREEAGDASSLPDSPKTPPTPTKYPTASPNEHSVCYLRRMELRRADFRGYERRSTPVIERWQSTPTGRSLLSLKEGKAEDARIAGTEPRSLTPEIRRNPSTRPQTLRPRAGNVKMSITSRKKNRAGDGCRPPFDYLVNLLAGIIVLVLMIVWLLRY